MIKRVRVLYKLRQLIEENLDELTRMVATENGKSWDDAKGDVLKASEATEVACGMPSLMMGESLLNASSGYDTVLTREPVGVFAGIVPFNFPAMIPMGWMTPFCVAAGKHHRHQSRQHDSYDLHADRAAIQGGGAARGRH